MLSSNSRASHSPASHDSEPEAVAVAVAEAAAAAEAVAAAALPVCADVSADVPLSPLIPVASVSLVEEAEPALQMSDLVRKIHDGVIAADSLSAQVRQSCVEHLSLEGFSTEDIADLLHISSRTVRRDRLAIRQHNALTPTLELGDELLGEYQAHTLASIRRLIRQCNDPNHPPYARLWAEEAIGRLYHQFIKLVHNIKFIKDGSARINELEKERKSKLPKSPMEEQLEKLMNRRGR